MSVLYQYIRKNVVFFIGWFVREIVGALQLDLTCTWVNRGVLWRSNRWSVEQGPLWNWEQLEIPVNFHNPMVLAYQQRQYSYEVCCCQEIGQVEAWNTCMSMYRYGRDPYGRECSQLANQEDAASVRKLSYYYRSTPSCCRVSCEFAIGPGNGVAAIFCPSWWVMCDQCHHALLGCSRHISYM